jgi:hypothetical protein
LDGILVVDSLGGGFELSSGVLLARGPAGSGLAVEHSVHRIPLGLPASTKCCRQNVTIKGIKKHKRIKSIKSPYRLWISFRQLSTVLFE